MIFIFALIFISSLHSIIWQMHRWIEIIKCIFNTVCTYITVFENYALSLPCKFTIKPYILISNFLFCINNGFSIYFCTIYFFPIASLVFDLTSSIPLHTLIPIPLLAQVGLIIHIFSSILLAYSTNWSYSSKVLPSFTTWNVKGSRHLVKSKSDSLY